MPTRYLKPGIRDSAKLEALSSTPDAEILYLRLLVGVDDFGRTDARPLMIKALCFPIRLRATADKCMQWLKMLASVSLIILYEVDNKPYLQITKWDNKPRAERSKFPAPPADVYTCPQMLPVTVTETVNREPELKPKQKQNKGNGAKNPFALPAELDPELWQEFIEMRTRMKKPATDRAKWLIVGRLANLEKQGHDPRKVLQQSIRNSWQDVFPIRLEGKR